MKFLLSTSSADATTTRAFWGQLQAVGAEVFFDEWSPDAGGSITCAIKSTPDSFDVLLLVWSVHASDLLRSRREYRAAVQKFVESPNRKVIVLQLDDTDVPINFDDARRVDLRDAGEPAPIMLRPVPGPRKRTHPTGNAIQKFLAEGGLDVADFPGYGTTRGCPRCGVGPEQIVGWHDPFRMYQGVTCSTCGWNDGVESTLAYQDLRRIRSRP